MQRQQLHPLRVLVEPEDAEIGDNAIHAAGSQPGLAPALLARQKAWARHEIDAVYEAALLMLHRDDHLRQAGDVVAATGSRQARRCVVWIPDERAVEVSVLVDLLAAHKAAIHIDPLHQN